MHLSYSRDAINLGVGVLLLPVMGKLTFYILYINLQS